MVDRGELNRLVERTAQDSGFAGVVRVDCADETVVSAAYGLADRRHGIPNTVATRFAVASCAKGFTALTVMSLVADDTLSLDNPVRPLLGADLPLIDDGVTIRQLLAHRSGIGDYLDEDDGGDIDDYVLSIPVHELLTTESYLAVLDGYPQREPPGEMFRYNNSGFVVLALVAERAAGRSYHQLVDERVVQRAGLTATSFERGDELPGDVAIGYLQPDGLRSNVLHLPVRGVGDGGIVTTADDVHRLWQALFADRIVPADMRRSMVEPVSEAPKERQRYGLGFWLHETRSPVSLEGIDAGVSFRSVFDPESEIIHTTLANTSGGAWPVTNALDAALGLE